MHKALGRGLDSLIPAAVTTADRQTAQEAVSAIAIDKIKPNKYQPRTNFNETKLKELAESIKQHGLAQPLLVAPSIIPGEYELIAGERRWRACRIAGLKEVAVVIRTVNDKERLQLAIIENIQRENLNPIEEGNAYKRLAEEFNHTQEELAGILGKDRSVIANTLRLLHLPDEIKEAISEGIISAGHGRILAGIDDTAQQKSLAKRILVEKLTVREIEKLVSEWKSGIIQATGKKAAKKQSAEIMQLTEELQRQLGTKIKMTGKPNKGKIEIFFYSLKELERIVAFLKTRKIK
jgi:ParB family chromosome partitioning protein